MGLISSCLADGSDPHTVLVPRSLSTPHRTPLAFSSTPWAVKDAAEWEQNQAGRSSRSRSGLRESFARPETAHTLTSHWLSFLLAVKSRAVSDSGRTFRFLAVNPGPRWQWSGYARVVRS